MRLHKWSCTRLRARIARVVRVADDAPAPKNPLETAIVEHVRAAGTIGIQQLERAPRKLPQLVIAKKPIDE